MFLLGEISKYLAKVIKNMKNSVHLFKITNIKDSL